MYHKNLQMRDKWYKVDAIVDSVVEEYHQNFNQSLQNFTQILRLFSDSRDSLQDLRKILKHAGQRFNHKSNFLREMYCQDITLGEMLKLFEDIEHLCQVPNKVSACQSRHEWQEAVRILSDGANKMAREEVNSIPSLYNIKKKLADCRLHLLEGLIGELEKFTAMSHQHRLRHVPQQKEFQLIQMMRNLYLHNDEDRPISSCDDTMDIKGCIETQGSVSMQRTKIDEVPWALERNDDKGNIESSSCETEGHLTQPEVSPQVLIGCIAQLDGIDIALKILAESLPTIIKHNVRKILEECLEVDASRLELPRPAFSFSEPIFQSEEFMNLQVVASKILDLFSMRCISMIESFFRLLQRLSRAKSPAISSGMKYICQSEEGIISQSSNARPRADFAFDFDSNVLPSSYEENQKEEYRLIKRITCSIQISIDAWKLIQHECRMLLAILFGTTRVLKRSILRETHFEDTSPSSGCLDESESEILEDSRSDMMQSLLSFSIEAEMEGEKSRFPNSSLESVVFDKSLTTENMNLDILESRPDRNHSKAINDKALLQPSSLSERDLEMLLYSAFGNHVGTHPLVAAAYMPFRRLVDSSQDMLAEVIDSAKYRSAKGIESISRVVHSPKFSKSKDDNDGLSESQVGSIHFDLSEESLNQFLDSSLKLDFLPDIAESMFDRCRKSLESDSSFKPVLFGNYFTSKKQNSTPILPIAFSAVATINDLFNYAVKIPPVSVHLFGILDNLLDRIHARLQSTWETCSSGLLPAQLVQTMSITHCMAQEKISCLLKGRASFSVSNSNDAMSRFLFSVVTSGAMGQNKRENSSEDNAERDLLLSLMQKVPFSSQSLFSTSQDFSRLRQAIAIANTADFIADALNFASMRSKSDIEMGSRGRVEFDRTKDFFQSSPGFVDSLKAFSNIFSRKWTSNTEEESVAKAYSKNLMTTSDRFRAIFGSIIRALRLDNLLAIVQYVDSWLCWNNGTSDHDVHEGIKEMVWVLHRFHETLIPLLSKEQRAYIFGDTFAAASHVAVLKLRHFTKLTLSDISEIQHTLMSLKNTANKIYNTQMLNGFSPSHQESKTFDWAIQYYALLTLNDEKLIKEMETDPLKYMPDEWIALVDVDVKGRIVSPSLREKAEQKLR